MYTKTEQFPLTMLIAKHLSVRQVIVQCGNDSFVCFVGISIVWAGGHLLCIALSRGL